MRCTIWWTRPYERRDPSNDIEVVLNGDQILIIKKETEEVLYRIALPENTDFDRMEYNFQKLSEDAKSNRVKSNDSKFNTNSRCMNHIYDNNVSKFFVYKIEIDFNFSSQMNIYQSFLYLSNFSIKNVKLKIINKNKYSVHISTV